MRRHLKSTWLEDCLLLLTFFFFFLKLMSAAKASNTLLEGGLQVTGVSLQAQQPAGNPGRTRWGEGQCAVTLISSYFWLQSKQSDPQTAASTESSMG